MEKDTMYTYASFPTGRVIRALLFDLGYTLWDRRADPVGWQEAETAANLRAVALLRQVPSASPLPALEDTVLGAQLREQFDVHEHDQIRHQPTREPDGPQAVLDVLLSWGVQANRALATQVFAALNVRFPPAFQLPADTLPILAALQARGYRLGVVTNRLWGGPSFLEDLEQPGLLAYFAPEAIAISANLGVRKPHPQLFLAALEALDVLPEEAAMVGDGLRTDILGAQRLGLLAVWKPRPKQLAAIEAYLAAGGHLPSPAQASQAASPQTPLGRTTNTGVDGEGGDADYQPAAVEGRDGYLERYLRGEIRPEAVIRETRELLDLLA